MEIGTEKKKYHKIIRASLEIFLRGVFFFFSQELYLHLNKQTACFDLHGAFSVEKK